MPRTIGGYGPRRVVGVGDNEHFAGAIVEQFDGAGTAQMAARANIGDTSDVGHVADDVGGTVDVSSEIPWAKYSADAIIVLHCRRIGRYDYVLVGLQEGV